MQQPAKSFITLLLLLSLLLHCFFYHPQALLSSDISDEWYFSYWDCPDSHLAVLQDTAYQTAWADAIAAAQHLIRDKIVLDVGCGLGTLSMLAAKVGVNFVS